MNSLIFLVNVNEILIFRRRLYLNDNNITEIGRGTFGSITRIGTIDLARNQIKKIDYQMFALLNYVEVIFFSFSLRFSDNHFMK